MKVTRLVDVAARAGVSRATAAQVLNQSGGASVRVGEATRQRVLAVARALRYRPNRVAQQLKGVRSRTLGVILDTVNMPVMSQRLAALERAAGARGYRLMIGQVHRDPVALRDYLQDFDGRGVDGIVCLFDVLRGAGRALRPLLSGRRDVLFHGKALVPGALCVHVDGRAGGRLLAEHLLSAGRRRLGFQFWSRDDEMGELRRAGVEASLAAAGLALPRSRIFYPEPAQQEVTPGALEKLVEHLVVRGRADAVLCSNDTWAVALIQMLKARGWRVPDDVAVTGYDDLEIARIVEPAVTTVDQRHDDYAEAAMALLLGGHERAAGAAHRVIITPRLVVRGSA